MPHYYFNLDDHEKITDVDGTELPNDDAARVEAIIFAADYLRDHPSLIWDGREMRVHVLRERREPLFVVVVLAIDLTEPTSVRRLRPIPVRA